MTFLSLKPKHKQEKEKEKRKFIKIKNFCASKDIIRKVKIQSTEWGKTFERHIANKELAYRTHLEILIAE